MHEAHGLQTGFAFQKDKIFDLWEGLDFIDTWIIDSNENLKVGNKAN